MLIKGKSHFVLIRIRTSRFRFTVPFPMYVLTITLKAFRDLSLMGDWVLQKIGEHKNIRPSEILEAVIAIFAVLSAAGRLTLVEVEAKGTQVLIELV